MPHLRSCHLDDLLMLSWGSTDIPSARTSLLVQEAVVVRVQRKRELACGTFASFAEKVMGILWAWSFAGVLGSRLLAASRQAIREGSKELDVQRGTPTPRRPTEGKDVLLSVSLLDPAVILDICDTLVLYKPPGWEVYNNMVEHQLTDFLRGLNRGKIPILNDMQHGCGFLHRLDVPSSGLVLAALTYQAWYELQMQLVFGSISRDYVVLCHGWVPAVLQIITARLRWGKDASVSPGHLGKPSATRLKVSAYTTSARGAMTLMAMQVVTGRKHQIRSHMAYAGHPTVHDGRYSASTTASEDAKLCMRNFLHRYHLSFLDAAGAGRSAWHLLPHDLLVALRELSPKDARSEEALLLWQGRQLQRFADLAALEKSCAP